MDRVPGSEQAAPIPMTTRPAISRLVVSARALSTDPPQKITTPISISRLRP